MQTTEKILSIGTKVEIQLADNDTYNLKEGVIVEVRRGFQEFDEKSGHFVFDGLTTLENTIKNIAIPYDFDGTTLKVYHSDYTRVSKYHRSYYTVRVLELDRLIVLSTDSLVVLAEPSELEQQLIEQLIEHRQMTANSNILRGITYAYDVTAYRHLPTVNILNDDWMVEDFMDTEDNGFMFVYECEIILTRTKMNGIEPITVLNFGAA